MRLVAGRIGENPTDLALIELVVGTIGSNGVPATPIFIGHGLCRNRPSLAGNLRRRMRIEPVDMLFTGVGPSKAMAELLTEGHTELTEPLVVREALARPNGTWMLGIANGEVAVLGSIAGECGSGREVRCEASGSSQHPVGRVEELRGLENHFDDMFVTMPTRTARGAMRQIEDVHSYLL